MPSSIIPVDISVLPIDVLSFRDKSFYELVAKIVDLDIAKLLEIQGIRSVYSFLHTDDVFDILSKSCPILKDVQSSICLETTEHTFLVKPGCRSGIQYLYRLLYHKHEDHLKAITKSRKRKQPMPKDNSDSTTNQQNLSQNSSPPPNIQQSTSTRSTFFL